MKKIDLQLREMSAYFNPAQFFIADNETITIRLVDRGVIKEKAYLQLNGCVFAFGDNKELTLSANQLKEVNACELQLRDDKGTVTKRWLTDNLFRPPIDRSVDGDYYETQSALLASVKALVEHVEELQKQQADNTKAITELQNGKFSIFKFGGTK
ncbi:MAG: hypothetical protein J1G02_06610 [Clostridiales bacterium]|nr:hypothetical protein [Clostridiales bacterium]